MINQNQQIRQIQHLGMKQIESLTLLEKPAAALTKGLAELTQDHPLLTIHRPKSTGNQSFEDWMGRPSGPSLEEHLYAQIMDLSLPEPLSLLTKNLVQCLDDKGYLNDSVAHLARIFRTDPHLVRTAIKELQSLDPEGIGAQSTAEGLLLQIRGNSIIKTAAKELLEQHSVDLANRRYGKILSQMKMTPEQLSSVMDYLRTLSPIPAAGYTSADNVKFIIPDIAVILNEGTIKVELIKTNQPTIELDQDYIMSQAKSLDVEANEFIEAERREYRELTKALNKRENTMLAITKSAVTIQRDFLLKSAALKPLTATQIAHQIGVNPSTVSRAIKQKYLLINHRLLPLYQLFSKGINEDASQEEALAMLKKIVDEEDPASPLTDADIRTNMSNGGLSISRRTVVKYRQKLGIPSSTKRRYTLAYSDYRGIVQN